MRLPIPTIVRASYLTRDFAFCFLVPLLLLSFGDERQVAAQTTVGPFNVSTTGYVTNVTSIPQPGSGHDYLHDLNETVNPANGALSIRIEPSRPHERGLNFPIYGFLYDSDNQYTIWMSQNNTTECNNPIIGCGLSTGYGSPVEVAAVTPPHYLDPLINSSGMGMTTGPGTVSYTLQTFVYEVGPGGSAEANCLLVDNYVYEDFNGVRHPLNMVTAQSVPSYGTATHDPIGVCNEYFNINEIPYGGDEQYKVSGKGYNLIGSGSMIDAQGDSIGGLGGSGLASQEDPNGNSENGTGRSGSYNGVGAIMGYGDSFSGTGTETVNIPGSANPYTYTLETISPTYLMGITDITELYGYSDTLCGNASYPSSSNGSPINSTPKVQSIQLPDGLSYQFTYDPVYGLINKIVYPTGAWVEYTWGVNVLSDAIGWQAQMEGVNGNAEPVTGGVGQAMNSDCYFKHDFPAITKRVVSYDGVHSALEQDFSYSTVWGALMDWNSKSTTVTTKDLLRSGTPSFTTVYNYIPEVVTPSFGSHTITSSMPMENTIVYNDTTGATLRTVKKVWNLTDTNATQLLAQCEILNNGSISGVFYQYAPYSWNPTYTGRDPIQSLLTDTVTDVAEYDYGTGVTSSCSRPSSAPSRETVTTYATFANTPIWPSFSYTEDSESHTPENMWDRPLTVQVYGNGTLLSETDYGYDQTAPGSAGATPIGHDETHYGISSTAARGNPTTITKKCFQGSQNCTNSVTTITYDTTGQATSVKDANGYTTTLSYADNYTADDGSPSGNTNTYMTTMTRPVTNGVSHISSYQYDFNKGELRTLTDENLQVSSYQYNDPWNRLTQSHSPDGGQVNNSYSDAGPEPTVTSNKLITSSGAQETSTVIMDGVGHTLYKQLTSDPSGTDITATTYDGLGRVYTVSNPYRSTSDPTYGLTTFGYDALNRTTSKVNPGPNGGSESWSYSGNNVTFTDENGNQWLRTSDALGRLTYVWEPNGSSQAPSMQTFYAYDALNDLLAVTQSGNGTGSVSRSFSYNSLSQLLTAQNPESGTICYGQWAGSTCANGYDRDGNLVYKTDARAVVTSYSYDALNRLLSKTYTNAPAGTMASCYQYDTAALGVGRLGAEWTQAGSCASAPPSNYQSKRVHGAYDAMGRAQTEQQCAAGYCTSSSMPSQPPSNCAALSSATGLQYCYDLADNLLAYSNGVTTAAAGSYPQHALLFSQTFDTAGRLATVGSSPSDSTHPASLFSNTSYAPNNALSSWLLGTSLWTARQYDGRLRVCNQQSAQSQITAPACQ